MDAMISLTVVVSIIVTLLIAGCVFGLLFLLINYVGSQFGAGAEPFVKVARVVLMVLAILFLIGMLLNYSGMAPGPLFTR